MIIRLCRNPSWAFRAFASMMLLAGGAGYAADNSCRQADGSLCPAPSATVSTKPKASTEMIPIDDEQPGELWAIINNEFNSHHASEGRKFGLQGQYDFEKAIVDGTFALIQEDGKVSIDEARAAGKRKFEIRGHEVAAGGTFWHDTTIDAKTNVGGAELATKGPLKTELTGGAYYGGIDLLGTNGNILMSWLQVERKLGPVELGYENFAGKIRGNADPSALGEGRYSKNVLGGVVDLREIRLTHMIHLAFNASVEKKHVDFGPYGPGQSETIGVVGVQVPLTGWQSRLAKSFREHHHGAAAGAQ